MKVLVGDEFGLIKAVDVNKKLVAMRYGEIKKKNAVVGISNLFETDLKSLAIAHEQNFYVINWATQEIKSQPEISATTVFTSQVVKRTIDFSSVVLSRSDNKLSIFQYDDAANLTLSNEFDIKTNKLQMIKDGPSTTEIFCLFKDSPISIWNLEKNEFTWKAKNVPNDELNLRVPIWDVDVAFQNNNTFYSATAYGEIRTYDRKVKPRPVAEKKIFDRKINRMLLSNCENYLTVGDTIGNIFMLDKRKNLSTVKSLKGNTGSIRDLVNLKKTNITMSCGLDRHLRVWDFKTGEDLPHIYLKNKLNVIFPYEYTQNNESESEGEDEEDGEDEDDFMEEGEFDEDEEDEDEDDISEEEIENEKKSSKNTKNK